MDKAIRESPLLHRRLRCPRHHGQWCGCFL